MGVLRLYAIGIDEVRDMHGGPHDYAQKLQQVAAEAFAPPEPERQPGLLGRLGPLFRRPPETPVVPHGTPSPEVVKSLLAGSHIPQDKSVEAWRAVETLVSRLAWGSTMLDVTTRTLDDLDFTLARGGVTSAVGLHQLLDHGTQINLLPMPGLVVGWHPHSAVLDMAEAYRKALPEVKTEERQEVLAALVKWLDGFAHWAVVATDLQRPAPDLVGFWAQS